MHSWQKYSVLFIILILTSQLAFAYEDFNTISKYIDELKEREVATTYCQATYEANVGVIIDATPVVEVDREQGFSAVDDVLVFKLKYDNDYDLKKQAEGIVRSLYKNGIIRILPGEVFLRFDPDEEFAYVVVPVIHHYDWLYGIDRVEWEDESYTIAVTYQPLNWDFVMRVRNPPCNDIFCRVPITDRYALWFSDIEYDPIREEQPYMVVRDDLTLYKFAYTYQLLYGNRTWRYDTEFYAGPSPLLQLSLYDKAPSLFPDYDSNDMYGQLRYAREYENVIIALFGSRGYDLMAPASFAIPIATSISTIHYVADPSYYDGNILDVLALSSLDDPATGETAKIYAGKLDSPVQQMVFSTTKTETAACTITRAMVPEEISEYPTEMNVIEGEIPIKDPVVEVFANKRASAKEKAWVRIDFFNTNDFRMHIKVDLRALGIKFSEEYNTTREFDIDPKSPESISMRIDYLTTPEANLVVSVTATAPRINPAYQFTVQKAVIIRADYYGIESFCLDENRVAKVSDNAVSQVIYCSDVNAKCYALTPTYAECRVNKPYEFEAQLDMMYKEMYGGTDPTKEMLLFGGTGAAAAILDAIGSVAGIGSISNALRSLTFWQTLMGGLVAVGVSYYLYKSMPKDCRLKPILAVLAPIIGLFGGATGLLLASGAAWLLCVFGGKKMKY